MLPSLLDVVLPRLCLGCAGTGWPFCPDCAARTAWLTPPGCSLCGRPLQATVDRCRDCPPPPIAWVRAPLLYEGPVRVGLIRLKFSGWHSAALALGPPMVGSLLSNLPPARPPGPPGPSVVTWVPLGRRRRGKRGFDQAEELARVVARVGGWPLRRLLSRSLETTPQARRSGPDRRAALRGAFQARGRAPPWVILVDDVLTSGATAGECARTLLDAGALEVGVLAAARSLGGAVPARCYNPRGLQPGSVVARGTASR